MSSNGEFQPEWTSAPGDTIMDILREQDISEECFASLMSLTTEDTRALLQGRSTVSIAVARRLSSVLGASVEYWMARDHQFRRDSRRLQESEERWLRKLPLGDMVRFGWLSPSPLPSEELSACLGFFGVSSIFQWQENYGSLQEMAAFRSSPTFDSRHESVAAWLRQGEIEADGIECGPWNSGRFQESLSQIRPLTRQKDPSRFIPELQEICSENGVAVVIVRSPGGCRASGATRFISNSKAILQLSFRYLTDDQFWFTFFHEAGHVLLHGERNFFASALEGRKPWILEGAEVPVTQEEQEANDFAAATLIPQQFQEELLSLPIDRRALIRFSYSVGVSPGVVVGQLQHSGRVRYNQLNGLKRRFEWQD